MLWKRLSCASSTAYLQQGLCANRHNRRSTLWLPLLLPLLLLPLPLLVDSQQRLKHVRLRVWCGDNNNSSRTQDIHSGVSAGGRRAVG